MLLSTQLSLTLKDSIPSGPRFLAAHLAVVLHGCTAHLGRQGSALGDSQGTTLCADCFLPGRGSSHWLRLGPSLGRQPACPSWPILRGQPVVFPQPIRRVGPMLGSPPPSPLSSAESWPRLDTYKGRSPRPHFLPFSFLLQQALNNQIFVVFFTPFFFFLSSFTELCSVNPN